MKKIILGIFISFGFIFLMSHNTSAIGLNIPVDTLWGNWNGQWLYLSNVYGSGVQCTSGYGCWNMSSPGNSWVSVLNTDNIRQMRATLPAGLTLNPGDYIETYFIIRNNNNDDSLDFRFAPFMAYGSNNRAISLLTMETERSTNNQSVVRLLFVVEGTTPWNSSSKYVYLKSSRCEDCNIAWTGAPGVEVTGGVLSFYRRSTETNYSQDLQDIKNGVTNLGNKVDDINNKQKRETQDASDNSSTEANSNSTDQTTTNLLGVFGSFVNAITSISPSNCNVDFDLGHIDFGVQNLCSQPVPQAFTVVTSIIVVCFTIPFVVHVIRRILSLIREMQT